ncbi:hypothetical protein ACFFRR_001966 [Megaselia abdita]
MSSLPAASHRFIQSDGVEDRPLSVYDNLNANPQATPIYSTPIKTKYNNNNNNSQQYSQTPAYMNLPRVGNNFSSPPPQTPNTTITTLPINDYRNFTTPSSMTSTSTPNRYSDSYDSSLSRAAVKAALNEAKSRFFGLTADPEPVDTSNTTYLLPQTRPYQNIPESSPSHPQSQRHHQPQQEQQSAVFYPPRSHTPERQQVDGGKKAPMSQSTMDLVTSPPSQVR